MSAAAHAICLALVLLDILARSWRIAIVLGAVGARIPFRESVALTALADAAAALTPWRVGGEPARVFGATRGGAPLSLAIAAMALDSAVTYLVLIPLGVALAYAFGSEWAPLAGAGAVGRAGLWLTLAAFAIATVVVLRHAPPHLIARVRGALSSSLTQLRATPHGELAALAGLSLGSLVARAAILPVIVASYGERTPFGATLLASFSLLNGQVLVPTPSGAGAIELAAAVGALGTHAHTIAVLATWRVYVTALPIVLGLGIGVVHYGGRAVSSLFRAS